MQGRGQKSETINPMHNKLVHQSSMVGIDDMAEWEICKCALYDGESDGQDDIEPRSLGMYRMCMYRSYAMHTQIPHDSESDGLDLESGESLQCPWLTRPALTHLQCNAMHSHTHTTPPALLQCLESRPLGGWIMPHAILLTHTYLIHTHSFIVI